MEEYCGFFVPISSELASANQYHMRISDVLKIIRDQLKNYDELDDVIIENLAGDNGPANLNGVVITLLKVEEEFALKNGKHHRLTQSFKVSFQNRKVFTNLYIIISCHDGYETSLTKLSKVIEFFQGKNIFTHLDGHADEIDVDENYKLIVELQDFSFEKINYIWSLFGGQHKPCVFYKVRLLPHEAKDKTHLEGEPVLKVKLEGSSSL